MARSHKPDRKSAGRSKIVPYLANEPAGVRHDRRLRAAIDSRKQFEAWCVSVGLSLEVSNDQQHWKMVQGDFIAEWWPRDAKLFIGQGSGEIHAHDWQQVKAVVTLMMRKHLEAKNAAVDGAFEKMG